MVDFYLKTPEQTSHELAHKLRQLRLNRKWKQTTLAERSGVSLGSLRRFESTGKVSLQNLLKLAFTLNRLDDFDDVLRPPPARSIAELEAKPDEGPKRGTV